jgi:hypothetical protein
MKKNAEEAKQKESKDKTPAVTIPPAPDNAYNSHPTDSALKVVA